MRKRKARDIKAEHAGVKQQNIVDVEMVNRALAQAEQVARAEKLAQANKSEAHETIMQKTVAQASQVEKQERKVRWVWQHPLLPFGIMQITVKEVATWYYVQKVASIVYQVTGMNLNRTITYTVMTGDQPSCGCPSFQHRTGQQTCQHVDALRVLEQQDQK